MSSAHTKRSPQLIVPLDMPDINQAMRMVDILADQVRFFKIGFELFSAEGPAVVDRVRLKGAQVFLDLKFHDIPNTVGRACRVVARYGVSLLTVHAAGGPDMIRAAVDAVTDAGYDDRPLVVAVTVLTSLNDATWQNDLQMGGPVSEFIPRFARIARHAGADGVVASPKDLVEIRNSCDDELVIVTPGIRPAGSAVGDQARVATPAEAVRDGADYLVVGRPIIAAPDPAEAAAAILANMQSATS